MHRDASDDRPPVAEDLALRVKPQRRGAGAAWRKRALALGGAAAALALAVGVYLLVRGSGSFSRRQMEAAPAPQLDAEIASAQERLKIDPEDIDALTELGTLHFEKGKDFYPDAINELEEARDLGALDARIFYCLGLMYQDEGLYSFALQEYQRFLRHYPDDKEIRMLEAKLLYKQGSYADAVREYERLRYNDPDDALIQENLGLSLWGAKQYDRAAAVFERLKSEGKDPAKRAEFYLGQIALEQNQPQDALAHFLRCQPEAGSDFGIPPEKVLAATAAAYQKAGRYAEAKASWQSVLALTPNDPKARAGLRQAVRRLGPARGAKSLKRKKNRK